MQKPHLQQAKPGHCLSNGRPIVCFNGVGDLVCSDTYIWLYDI